MRSATWQRVRGHVGVAALLCLAFSPAWSQEPPGGAAGGRVNFSFDQVDIATFARLVQEYTGRKLVVADNVKGRVTVVSPAVERRSVYPLFVSILESAGCSVVEDGDVSRVVALPPREIPSAPVLGTQEAPPGDGVYTKVFWLQHASVSEWRKVLESKVGGGKVGGVAVVEETNHLIVTDTAGGIRRIEKLIAEIDRPGTMRTIEVVLLQYASAESLADQLAQAMAETESRGEALKKRLPSAAGATESGGRRMASIVAAPDSNNLLLVGTPAQIQEMRQIIAKLDVDVPSGRGRLNAMFLKYALADEAAASLNALMERTAKAGGTAARQRAISIEANKANNALLIDATAGDFEVVRKVVEQLDQMPQQVHIRVVILEHGVDDGLDLGVEMASMEMPGGVGKTTVIGSSSLEDSDDTLLNAVQSSVFPKGLSVGVAYGTRLDADGNLVSSYPALLNIDALRKSGSLKIVSETALETQNNKEATVNIVDEIPILKSTVQGGSGTSRDIIQNIDRVDVGIKLSLTPHVIMPDQCVQMVLNPSIEAIVESKTTSSSSEYTPTIAKRSVSTTVTVPDGRTIVIAGLTREDKSEVVHRVPLLGSLPLVGWLFRHTSTANQKTDMLILVTPQIVRDVAAAETIMKDWQDRTGLVNEQRK